MWKLVFILSLAGALIYFWHPFLPAQQSSMETGGAEFGYITLDGVRYHIEIADTPEKQETGLMHRTAIGSDGMLFVFPKPDRYAFWMKNTKIPLDMFWINDGAVNYIVRNAVPATTNNPESYNPPYPASYVLEMAAGSADHLHITEGTRFETDIVPK